MSKKKGKSSQSDLWPGVSKILKDPKFLSKLAAADRRLVRIENGAKHV